mgnify:FL=1|tara:strand:- start:356 stop:517 length:162 start_codon:yes stop_codon:yes gene_type:complete
MNKNKFTYQGKGTVKTKDVKSVAANTKPTPGMGKGKARGVGIAEFGTKFSGVS